MPDRPEAILIVSGGLLQLAAAEAARELGLVVLMTDRNLGAPAMQLADEAFEIDTFDTAGHIELGRELAKRWALRGVFCQGADVEVTVASVAADLGLPGIGVPAARTTKNKAAMRAAFDRAGVINPGWREAGSVGETVAAAVDLGLPVYVKALDNSASRGTTRVDRVDDLAEAFDRARASSTTGTALIEQCYEGDEQSVEILFDERGTMHALNIVDRVFSHDDGWALELGHVNPTGLSATQKRELYELTAHAAAACGVSFGVFKADTVWTAAGPRIIEVASRLSGGFDAQATSPISSGRNLIKAAMSLAIGDPLDLESLIRTRNTYAAAWSSFPTPGVVVSIDNEDEVRAMEGVEAVHVRIGVGETIPGYVDCASRPAWVIAEGPSHHEAMRRARAGAEALRIRTETHNG